jgi:hypothetical protein
MGKTPQDLRIEIDKRNRHAYFRMLKMDGLFMMPPTEAERLIADFLTADKNKVDPATNVQQLAKSKQDSVT